MDRGRGLCSLDEKGVAGYSRALADKGMTGRGALMAGFGEMRAALVGLGLGLSLLTWGAGGAARGLDVDCGAAATQSALNMCAAAAQGAAEADMARAYEALEMRLSAGGRAALGAAQGAWEVFRQRHCAFVAGGVAGGSVAPMIYSQCAQALSGARTRELSALMVCAEGDLACPR